MNSRRDVIAFCVLAALSIAIITPLMMREQKEVQHTKSDLWPKLAASKLEKHYLEMQYSIAYTPEVKALEGKPVTVDGFVIPLESKELSQHFLLTIRSPTCSFCLSGKPNEMIEVFAATPLKWSDALISLRGMLALMPEKNSEGIFFQLKDAELVKSHPIEPPLKLGKAKPARAYRFAELSGDHYQHTKEINWPEATGKPMLVAFWRSDCAPCLQEMKLLPAMATAYPDLSIVLISLHDAQHTRNHLAVFPDNVRVLVAMDDAASLLQAFGNERTLALPYSVMLDANGNNCANHNGILSPETLKKWRAACD